MSISNANNFEAVESHGSQSTDTPQLFANMAESQNFDCEFNRKPDNSSDNSVKLFGEVSITQGADTPKSEDGGSVAQSDAVSADASRHNGDKIGDFDYTETYFDPIKPIEVKDGDPIDQILNGGEKQTTTGDASVATQEAQAAQVTETSEKGFEGTNETEELTNPGDFRVVENNDGSTTTEVMFPDGEVRAVQTTEPDGKTTHEYQWEESEDGQWKVTGMEDTDSQGHVTTSTLQSNGETWHVENPDGSSYDTRGEVRVARDGSYRFINASDDAINPGGQYNRNTDGSEVVFDSNGREILRHPPSERSPEFEGETRVVENTEDGSRVEYNTVNGEEVVSAVVRPNGERTEYGYDENGEPNKTLEYDANGNLVATTERDEGNTWTVNDGTNEFEINGQLTVSEDGSHTFREQGGNEFQRNADGSFTYTLGNGFIVDQGGPQEPSELRLRDQQEYLDGIENPGELVTDAPGNPDTNAGQYDPEGDAYDPVRPVGLGGHLPGEASSVPGEDLDSRSSRSGVNRRGDQVYDYEGDIANSDATFTASEIFDENGNLVNSRIDYSEPVDQTFKGPNGAEISLEGVTAVESAVGDDGTMQTAILTEDGTVYWVPRDADGTITDFRALN